MSLPIQVKIFAHTFQVTLLGDSAMHGSIGHCDTNALRIDLLDTLPETVMRETLIHEIFHAINYMTYLKDGDEERHVNCFAMGLVTVLRDNPELKEYLLQP
jgi:hypothetical protein